MVEEFTISPSGEKRPLKKGAFRMKENKMERNEGMLFRVKGAEEIYWVFDEEVRLI